MSQISPTSSSDPASEGESLQISFANLGDVEALVVLHLKCFSGDDHIAVLFGEHFIRAVYKWFVTDEDTYVLVAKKGDTLVGFTALADKPYNGPMLKAAKKEAFQGLLKRPWLIFHPELVLRVVRMIFPKSKYQLEGKVAHIAFTAVDDSFRRMGIAKALKMKSIQVCRERGVTSMVTGVKKENFRAKAMNESAGFVEVPEMNTRRFIYLKLDLNRDVSKEKN